ncbi:MAG: PDZ domain-containing protein [Planctomycetota bacterium]
MAPVTPRSTRFWPALLTPSAARLHRFFFPLMVVLALASVLPAADAPPPAAPAPYDPLGPMVPITPQVAARARNRADAVDLTGLRAAGMPAYSLEITAVTPGGAAYKAGLKVGDRIVSINGNAIESDAWFEAVAKQYLNGYMIDAWSPGHGITDYAFHGLMGIHFNSVWDAASSYLENDAGSPAWDDWVVAAAQDWEDHPDRASAALEKARQAGYRGHLLPAFRLLMAAQSGRYQVALDAADRLGDYLPVSDRPVVYRHLVISQIWMGRIEEALEMAAHHPYLQLDRHQWDPGALLTRALNLTPAQRNMIRDGRLAVQTAQDFAGKWQPQSVQHLDGLTTLKANDKLSVTAAPGDPASYVFGPACANPAFAISVTIPPTQRGGPPPGQVTVELLDAAGQVVNSVVLQTDGYVLEHLLDSPTAKFNGDQSEVFDAPNQVEVTVCGPWCEFRLNGHCLARGTLDNDPNRQLSVAVEVENVTATLARVSYRSVQPAAAGPAAEPLRPPGLAPAPPIPTDPHLRWLYHTWIDTYLKDCRRDPAWDAQALAGLMAFLPTRNVTGAPPDLPAVYKKLQAAIALGCDDPLVCYAAALLSTEVADSSDWRYVDLARNRMLDWLQTPGAPSLPSLEFDLQLWMYRWESGNTYPALQACAAKHLARVEELITAMAGDRSMPVGFVAKLTRQLVYLQPPAGSDRQQFCQPFLDAIAKSAPDSSLLHLMQGRVEMAAGWDARGGGWSNQVTDAGAQQFGLLLTDARSDFQRAYSLDHHDADAMAEMIYCCMGLGDTNDQMDGYFQAALAANPNNTNAYHNRLWSLMPRWGGSHEQMRKVADHAVEQYRLHPATTSYEVPLEILELHDFFCNDYTLNAKDAVERGTLTEKYWSSPGVWKDVHGVFDLILAQLPGDRLVQSQYLYWAVRCQQWDAAKKLYQEIQGEICYPVFGGRASYSAWLKAYGDQFGANQEKAQPKPQPAPEDEF